jgi:hypothetical protein
MRGLLGAYIGHRLRVVWDRTMNVSSVPDHCCKDNGVYFASKFWCTTCNYRTKMSKKEYVELKFDVSPNGKAQKDIRKADH